MTSSCATRYSSWIESALGARDDEFGRLSRQDPRPLVGPRSVAAELATDTGLDADVCSRALARALLIGNRLRDARGRPILAFRLHLLLTTVNWTTSKLQLLGSRPTLGQRDQLGLTLMDSMLATSAARAHFPAHSFQHHRFVDGGLAANAPDLHALQCAQQMSPGAEVHMLSIGTANPLHGRDPSAVPGRGLMWAGPVIELVTCAQEMLAVQECAARMGTHRYLRLNMPPSSAQQKQLDFDVADQTSTDLLLSLADDCLASLQPADWQRLKAIVG